MPLGFLEGANSMAAIGTGIATKPTSMSAHSSARELRGLKIESAFCPSDTDPFDTVEWDLRTAAIKDEDGKVLFEQTGAEIPADWSQLATNVVVSKYFYGEVN